MNKHRNLIRRARDCRQGVSVDVCSIPNSIDGRSFYVKNMNYSSCSSVNSQLLKPCREEGVDLLEVNSSDIPTVGKDGVHYSYASANRVGDKIVDIVKDFFRVSPGGPWKVTINQLYQSRNQIYFLKVSQ